MKCKDCEHFKEVKSVLGYCPKLETDSDDPLDGITAKETECQVPYKRSLRLIN